MKNPLESTLGGTLQLAAVVGVGLLVWVWFGIFSSQTSASTLYVLNIGQGDSQLIVLGSEKGEAPIKILIDGGKDKRVLTALDEALGPLNNKYIDLVIMTHTDLDHMGGLVEVLRRYEVGMFISNGRTATSDAYHALTQELSAHNTPTMALLEGDAIRYGGNRLAVLSPDQTLLRHKEVNESSLVILLTGKAPNSGASVLFTGDIGFPAERVLLAKKYAVAVDVLKVGHHGSKNSSGENFIAAVRPLVSVIGVGKNSYGHPTARVLKTLALAGSHVYRTDLDGTLEIPLGVEDKATPTQATSPGPWAAVASVVTGAYKQSGLTVVSLQQAREEKGNPAPLLQRPQASPIPKGQSTSCAAGQIDINTASKDELMQIKNIGEARADDIIANRPFSSLAGLRGAVSGIGEARLADITAEGKACAAI